MNYVVRRGEEEFGPYTLADLQEYVATGYVSADELTKSEGMETWVPVSKVLGNIPAPVGPAIAADLVAPPQSVKLPPNLHWLILLVLMLVTQQVFNFIWALVLANWARRLSGNNKALVLVAMYPAGFLAAAFSGLLAGVLGGDPTGLGSSLSVLFVAGGLISYLFGIFTIRREMEDYYNSTENIGLTLHSVMTWFFSSVYLQYHVNKIAKWKKTGIIS